MTIYSALFPLVPVLSNVEGHIIPVPEAMLESIGQIKNTETTSHKGKGGGSGEMNEKKQCQKMK